MTTPIGSSDGAVVNLPFSPVEFLARRAAEFERANATPLFTADDATHVIEIAAREIWQSMRVCRGVPTFGDGSKVCNRFNWAADFRWFPSADPAALDVRQA